MPFLLPNIFNKKRFWKIFDLFFKNQDNKTFFKVKIFKTQGKNQKLKEKNPKLKEKTQALGVLILALAPN